jgi:hypothetical protein
MLMQLALPPGVKRGGTELQSEGHWYDANFVRFVQDTIRPIGGWSTFATSTLTGKGRAILSWRDNSGNNWTACATESKLYAISQAGAVYDITPAGFTTGYADASSLGGYGVIAYGQGNYGQPASTGTSGSYLLSGTDATVWTLDTFGQYLVGVSPDDGKLYEWTLATGTPAAVITNAPTSCSSLVVTAERFVMALGAGGVPRTVQWCDQGLETVWTPSTTNQAGSYQLVTSGRIMTGKRVLNGTLIFCDTDVHLATYLGYPLVYGFQKIGTGCGVISRNCVAVHDATAAWMGQNGFWTYNGYVSPLECPVQDYVFSNLNRVQASKCHAVHNSLYNEVWWFYVSNASTEIDKYVVWNYSENHWSIGSLSRLAGCDVGSIKAPIMVDGSGQTYYHENGFTYDGTFPYVESGPFQLGDGTSNFNALELWPDDKTVGDVTATFTLKSRPDAPAVVAGPYSLSDKTDTRFFGRQVKVKYTATSNNDWRVGIPRLMLTPAGTR